MLILLAAVFIVPVLISWLMYKNMDIWWSGTTANYGQLITPVKPISSILLRNPEQEPFESDFLKRKWTLVIFSKDECDATCRESLYKTRQIRILLKRDQVRVQRLYISNQLLPPKVHEELTKAHSDLLVAYVQGNDVTEVMKQFEPDQNDKGDAIYLVDPMGNYMMRYPPEMNSKMILKDMQRLLKVSRVG